jgi:hypothetical protein
MGLLHACPLEGPALDRDDPPPSEKAENHEPAFEMGSVF